MLKHQVRVRAVLGAPPRGDCPCTSALPPTSDHRQRIGGVHVAVAHAAAVDESASGRAASRRRRGVDRSRSRNFANSCDVVGVHAARAPAMRSGLLPWCESVWCGSVDADLRIGPLAELARHHEREHAREVGLVGERQQVEHQRRRAPRTTPGTPTGASGTVERRLRPAARPAGCAARSRGRCRDTRRAACRSARPDAASPAVVRSSATKSRMLRSSRIRARRCSARAAAAEHPLEHRRAG